MGEEIHGPGGYFGRNINAMYDCFRGGFGVKSIQDLHGLTTRKVKSCLNLSSKKLLRS
ncbi:hypothetical protein EJ377_14315 [Chryseobacterium arthrosphaerae]|uniref:Uncharacterized protein n=1 Tax=Chryseobacterium arthrosphaerae TaxID=651561 RepID=A0A3S0N2J8_9FLAO|nr:hypothetical protein EJ377_14315 [Chryseobacterium arthrosphaerae]